MDYTEPTEATKSWIRVFIVESSQLFHTEWSLWMIYCCCN